MGNNLRYFYRKKTNGEPIAGTLVEAVKAPRTGKWGEIKKEDYERKVSCCDPNLEDAELLITGPTGTIANGADEYEYTINSNVTGIPDDQVQFIALYIDDVFIEQQAGNSFSYDGSGFAENPEVPVVYYTIAVLVDGTTLVSPILQFTLTNAAPTWSTQLAFYIANNSTTMHICDMVNDVNLDTLNVSFLTLPAFITPTLIPVTGVSGNSIMIVDLLVAPTGVGDNGTYSFTMVANDGAKISNKVVSLIIDGNAHQRYTTRPNGTVALTTSTPAFTVMDTLVVNTQMNGVQLSTLPQPNIAPFSNTTGPGTVQFVTTSIPTGAGKQVTLIQSRNGSTGTGNRYEDCAYLIITVT